ncbi:type I restriction endonuclease subunit R [Corynebacterium sp. TAE3-ERU30]|uniref:type I restriction endonuclease subunit R n=1 Tax=Corynebacterium sp. TAE3-ERU30 TaxID=2849496 RepID=UPI001C458F9C|nr:type I restriction endonuclease subunit R [Corynebacterium sp. TAE3-ERU30]MBV7282837.1 type I restriction endonuclease subunit R [Corynebacterium sp. TAE3-ERU30]
MAEVTEGFSPIAVSDEATVVSFFEFPEDGASSYQSESALEEEFISILQEQGYEYVQLHSEDQLLANLRSQLSLLNSYAFTNSEWDRFFTTCIAPANEGITEKTRRIQEDPVQLLTRDDGTVKNIRLLDTQHIHNNRLQVINQYAAEGASAGATQHTRYDVTVLVNGLPLVHIELKRRGVDIREAFNQINRYWRDSFWSGTGLYQYVQLFVISNGTLTKYYSNSTRSRRIKESQGGRSAAPAKNTSNSFEFTSWWADAQNHPIRDLTSFARTFFSKHSLLNILTKYCVLTADGTLLAMRPYQIVATERILQRITRATNYHTLGSVKAGGYIWHTTGSGKTLTSFKTAQLASRMESVDKVLFVVDRKDLDYQTMKEYDRFQKGAANSNTSTAVLARQLADPKARIIITTIQKLARFIAANPGHPVYSQHVVIIFDECHRSQFGDMHKQITKAFKRYNLFGFTGTPIFAQNCPSSGTVRTTEHAFGTKLHTYTIVDAITDKNVLPFKIDYINTVQLGAVHEGETSGIDTEKALLAPERIAKIVDYTLDHYAQKTKRKEKYRYSQVTNVADVARDRKDAVAEVKASRRIAGFNSIFATASIEAARRYYNAFREQQKQRIKDGTMRPDQQLRIAIIYSYAANEAETDDFMDEEGFDTGKLDTPSRDFLEQAIQDYNDLFGTSYDTSAESFQSYYKDLSMRLKNRQLDMVIVVNMFLTGFDATTLNTLWADKNLRSHGLIQAYSRTNRILNSVKTYGNIVSFRDLEEQTNDALALFGNKDARGVVLMKPYSEYYQQYADKASELLEKFPVSQPIVGEAARKEFIELFGAILRLLNILTSFDEFAGNEILGERELQDYRSIYLDLYDTFRGANETEKEDITDDVTFEIELVRQVEITVDYILLLVEKYISENGKDSVKNVRAEITRAINASPTLRNRRDLIEQFVNSVTADRDVSCDWVDFITLKEQQEFEAIVTEENLNRELAKDFMDTARQTGMVPRTGTGLASILQIRRSRFAKPTNGAETLDQKKKQVRSRLEAHLERFQDLIAPNILTRSR